MNSDETFIQIEPTIEWAKLARQYIALRNRKFLRQAIAIAGQSDDEEIIQILKCRADRDLDRFAVLVKPLIQRLFSQKRYEESLTIALLGLAVQSAAIEQTMDRLDDEHIVYFKSGMTACEQAIEFSIALKDKPCEAVFQILLGNGFQALKQFDQAKKVYTKALKTYRKLSAENYLLYLPDLASVINNLGTIFYFQNEFAKAEKSFVESSDLYRSLAISNPQTYLPYLADALDNLAAIQKDKESFPTSKKTRTETLTIYRSLAAADPQRYLPDLAKTLFNLGRLNQVTFEFKETENAYVEALKIFRGLAADDSQTHLPDVARTLQNLGNLYRTRNEFEEAEKAFNEAFEIYKNCAVNNRLIHLPNVAIALNSLAILKKVKNELVAAEHFSAAALKIRRELVAGNPEAHLPEIGNALHNLGEIYRLRNNLGEAEKVLDEALEVYRNLAVNAPAEYLPKVATTLHSLGILRSAKRDFKGAEKAFNDALGIYLHPISADPQLYLPDVALTLNNLGILHYLTKNAADADTVYSEALKIYRNLAADNPQAYLPNVATLLSNLGHLSIAQNNYQESFVFFLEAKKIIEDLRENLQDINLRKQIFQDFYQVYRGLLISFASLGKWENAIEIAEQGKSSSLNDHLSLQTLHPSVSANETAENKANLAKAFEKYLETIKNSQITESILSAYFQEIADINDDDTVSRLKRENLEEPRREAETRLFELRSKRNNILVDIRRFDPNYPYRVEALTFKQILDISEKSKHAIVIFRVLEQTTFIFIIFPDRTYEPISVSDFTSRNFNKIFHSVTTGAEGLPLSEPDNISRREAVFEKDSEISNVIPDLMKKISENLIKPVRQQLEKKAVEDVVFVPSGSLAVLPLHACFDETRKRYMIEDFNIKFSTSVSLFKKAWENSRKCSELSKLLFITNPRKDLKFAEQEVAGICRIYGLNYKNYQHNLIRQKATIKAVKEKMAQDFDIIHFACHGNYKSDEPFSSPLEMAKNHNLHLKEIMQMKLSRTRLVVLSACKTGMVNAQDISDEHYGFPFGFILSGTSSIWGTLWSVDDEATSILMEKAYRYLKEGKEISVALRQSQIEMCREAEYSAPYYWASFQHFGF